MDALLLVMLVSLPFAWMYLLPSSFVDFAKSILFSLGFSSILYLKIIFIQKAKFGHAY